jgi:hypothetical protein
MALRLLLLLAFGGILHLAHPAPAQAHASGPEIVAVSDGADRCELGDAAPAGHCHLASACPLCAPVGAAVAMPRRLSAHLSLAVATLLVGGVVDPRLHPPMPASQA